MSASRVLRIVVLGPPILVVMAVITLGLPLALPIMWILGLRPDAEDLLGPYEALAEIVWDGAA